MADHLNAGVGPHHRPDVRLTPFSKLNWKISDGDPDIRGWEVRTVGGRVIGKVNDLLVDEAAREVVMLEVDLDGTDRHALAPIRAADIDRDLRVVRIDSSDVDGDLPWLSRRGTTEAEAQRFSADYDRAYGARGWDRERNFVVDRDDDEVHFRSRQLAAAEAEAYREEARRERVPERPVTGAADLAARYGPRESAQDAAQLPRDPKVVEEVVVRRRIVSPEEAARDPHLGER
ncbi:MAG TPA: PRC-barrel domain-containing protein [Gemmatimonadales bacterium]